MTSIPFTKMSGSGNDFIMIDNREGRWTHLVTPAFVRAVCRRQLSIGADGVIFIEPSTQCDFRWRFFNADGSEAEMCGNGGRCAARYAVLKGAANAHLQFETLAGVIHADVRDAQVNIQLTEPADLEMDIALSVGGRQVSVHSINTGVPHVVWFVEDLETIALQELGAAIRYHERFQPAGTNVNFVAAQSDGSLAIRTYERGVEGETFACGTGSVAAALVAISRGMTTSPVTVRTRGGESLTVTAGAAAMPFAPVFLQGGARVVYAGSMTEEAYDDACDA